VPVSLRVTFAETAELAKFFSVFGGSRTTVRTRHPRLRSTPRPAAYSAAAAS
jgi:hypothetical protein